MTSRRILLISHEYPPLGGGGGNAVRHIARGLARLGHQPIILTTAWPGLPAQEEADGVMIRRISAGRSELRHISTGEGTRFMAAAMLAARGLTTRHKIDAVVTFFTLPAGPVGLFLKRLRGLRYVVALQPGDVPQRDPEEPSRFDGIVDRGLRYLWLRAGAVVANSQGLFDIARAFAPKQAFEVIPAGADVDGITPKEDYSSTGEVKLLYVGRLEKQKGLDVLLPALAKLSSALKWKLAIVGDGPEWPVVAALAARFALIDRIELHGWQGWNSLPEIYRSADVFVLPSREEGMPAALLEAMATGLPVVSTRVAGAGEAVLHGKTGLLAPPDNSEALADALTQMIADPTRWEAMGRAGRARVESYYSWTNVAAQWLDVIERVLGASS